MEFVILALLVVLSILVYVFVRLDALSERVEVLEQALRRVAPADVQVGGSLLSMRVEVDVPIRVRSQGKTLAARLRDLSLTGAQVEVEAQFGPGETFAVCLPHGDKEVETRSKIARVISPGVYGVQFVVPNRSFQKTVKAHRAQALRAARRRALNNS